MSHRHEIVEVRKFWERLELESCRWIENSNDPFLKQFWIDGFSPERATNTSYGINVSGVAWVGNGSRKQWPYRFTASLPQKLLYRRDPQCVIQQLTIDDREQVLHVKLSAAPTLISGDNAQ